jgi:uncharacterized membrane protein YhdT
MSVTFESLWLLGLGLLFVLRWRQIGLMARNQVSARQDPAFFQWAFMIVGILFLAFSVAALAGVVRLRE